MKVPYKYAIYNSSHTPDVNAMPCMHKLASRLEWDEPAFPVVETKCSACNERHNFQLSRVFAVASAGEEARFKDWCASGGVEVMS